MTALSRLGVEEMPGEEHLAEDRGGLRQREAGVVVDAGSASGQDEVEAVPQFVGDGRHVPQVAGVVEQDIGEERRGHPHAEGAAALAGPGVDVHPPVGEEGGDDLFPRRAELPEGGLHQPARLVEPELPVGAGERGVDVGIFQFRQVEEFCLEREIFPRQAIVLLRDLHEPAHDPLGQFVPQVGGGHRVGVSPEFDLLAVVQDDGVEDRAQDDLMLLVLLEERGEGPLPDRGIRMVEQGEEFLAGELPDLAVQFHLVDKGG